MSLLCLRSSKCGSNKLTQHSIHLQYEQTRHTAGAGEHLTQEIMALQTLVNFLHKDFRRTM
ncbi:hypothetical protein DPMN_027787 [Dreissena polymorpha]|uniref:Uncharacterized protein n=1 Tax=Dreissena polymorpha TaxID=45954 RepID=A0A9D4LXQ5_DREPO|nr:hypothetical protein DPMN_027787 [Dreissena polymorpha]